MIWKSIVTPCATTSASARWSAVSRFARKTTETVSDFASVIYNLVTDARDSYRPELHYMRGPGPKWRAKHQPWLRGDSEAVSLAVRRQTRQPQSSCGRGGAQIGTLLRHVVPSEEVTP